MKIVRTSRLSSLTPWLILALLIVSPGLVASAAAQDKTDAKRPAIKSKTLMGSKKGVVATTVVKTEAARPRTMVGGTITEFSLDQSDDPQLMAVAPDGSIFYCLGGSNKIGQIVNPGAAGDSLEVREFPIPTTNSYPEGRSEERRVGKECRSR